MDQCFCHACAVKHGGILNFLLAEAVFVLVCLVAHQLLPGAPRRAFDAVGQWLIMLHCFELVGVGVVKKGVGIETYQMGNTWRCGQ